MLENSQCVGGPLDIPQTVQDREFSAIVLEPSAPCCDGLGGRISTETIGERELDLHQSFGSMYAFDERWISVAALGAGHLEKLRDVAKVEVFHVGLDPFHRRDVVSDEPGVLITSLVAELCDGMDDTVAVRALGIDEDPGFLHAELVDGVSQLCGQVEEAGLPWRAGGRCADGTSLEALLEGFAF